jgi:CDP-diglyceride synthetase
MTSLEPRLLLLLLIANGAPILARHLFGERFTWPLDGGLKTAAGNPLLGHSKTWRGLAAAILLTASCAPLLDIHWGWGATIGALAMLGDLLASFTKRRLGYAPSSRADGLDQIPESLLPLAVAAPAFHLDPVTVAMMVIAFYLVVPLLSRLFFLLGIRRRPY